MTEKDTLNKSELAGQDEGEHKSPNNAQQEPDPNKNYCGTCYTEGGVLTELNGEPQCPRCGVPLDY